MTFEAQLTDGSTLEHLGIAGAVWRMAGVAALELEGRMFEYERALLVAVAFYARLISADR